MDDDTELPPSPRTDTDDEGTPDVPNDVVEEPPPPPPILP